MSWSPIGSPAWVKPQGTDTPGIPARLAGTVNTSLRYIWSGSALSPILNATFGVVGAAITSTPAKAASKSRLTRVRTRWARP